MRRRLFELSRARRRLADRVWVATAQNRQTLYSQYRRWLAWRARRTERRWIRRQERSLAPRRLRTGRVTRAAAALVVLTGLAGVAALAGGSSPERLAQWAPDIGPDDAREQPVATTGDRRGGSERDRDGDAERNGHRKPTAATGVVGAGAPDRASTEDSADRDGGEPSGPGQPVAQPRSPTSGGTTPRARSRPNSDRTGQSVRPNRPTPDAAPRPAEPTTPVAPAPEPVPAPAPAEPAPAPKPEKPPKETGPPADRPDRGGGGDGDDDPGG